MSIIHDPALYQLRHALRGHVYDPGEPEYEDACTLFNAMIETRPRHVARVLAPAPRRAPRSRSRATRGLRVAVRARRPLGRRHVARRRRPRHRRARPARASTSTRERRVARVGGGADLGASSTRATQEHGLATVGGRVSTHRRRRAHARRRLGLARAQARPRRATTCRRRARHRRRRARPRDRRRAPRAVLGAARRRRQLRRRDRVRVRAAPGRARR